jgi:3' terminal RNA ribose 2'-O-methyltransferase Hen1
MRQRNVKSVLDLGCGEGKLIARLIKERGIDRIVGVDPSVRTLEAAHRKLRLHQAGDAMSERVELQMGSLTYGDRRWKGFDAATLVEVIEHIESHRLSALVMSLFADARPNMVVMTTPNREYNALFETMKEDQLRHPDHRFEWTRAEFEAWANDVADKHGYTAEFAPLGPVDETHGGPSQMAIFTLGEAI